LCFPVFVFECHGIMARTDDVFVDSFFNFIVNCLLQKGRGVVVWLMQYKHSLDVVLITSTTLLTILSIWYFWR